MAKNIAMKFDPKKFTKDQIPFMIIMIPLCIFMGLPLIYLFSTAFKPLNELLEFPPKFFVKNPTFKNFSDLLTRSGSTGLPIYRYLINSIFISLAVVVLSVLFSSMAGYILSKKDFRGRKALFEINTIALMFVSCAVVIPRFLIITGLGITNTIWAHILPLLAIPVGLFLIKQFIDDIPNDLIEAARVDGAGDFYIYLKIILPLIKPALVTVAILAFQSAWNNTETAMLYVSKEELQTFAYYLGTLSSAGNSVSGAGVSAAAALILFLPNLIIFIIMQSKVIDTMAYSGMK
jgi:ABC-type glycerol-3-phosphate transport system permease component